MPLTPFQGDVARLVSRNRSLDSYLAGGAALHFEANSQRFSNDLDYFQDSVERVAAAFAADQELLLAQGYDVRVDLRQPGYIRAVVSLDPHSTKVEWAHDSAWRFLPAAPHAELGFVLQPIDLAINKLLALVGRDEPRDFLDVMHVHDTVLPLGAMCWAAAGKDPGFTPASLLSLLRRRGRYQPEEFNRLHLTAPIDLVELKTCWLDALEAAEEFVASRPPEELGCLYHSTALNRFVAPSAGRPDHADESIVPHFGRPGGVVPRLL